MAKSSKKPKKSQKYRVYPMSSEKIKRKIDKKTKAFRKVDKWNTVLSCLDLFPDLYESRSNAIHFGEFQWTIQGRNALFINLNDIKTIERGVCKVKFIPDRFLPFKSFMVCLPSDYEVQGIRPTGVMVTSFDTDEESVLLGEEMRKIIDPDSDPLPVNKISKNKKGVTISYRCGNHGVYTNLVLYDDHLTDVVNCKSFSEFCDAHEKMKIAIDNDVTMHGRFNEELACQQGLTIDERKVQYALFKLVMSLSMYIKAKPDVLTEGFPVKGGFTLSEPFSEPVRGKTVNVSTKHKNSPEEHHRGWFIRQLVAECYYRGEYKDLEPGSRMVFVDETTVNLNVASHNIQG